MHEIYKLLKDVGLTFIIVSAIHTVKTQPKYLIAYLTFIIVLMLL